MYVHVCVYVYIYIYIHIELYRYIQAEKVIIPCTSHWTTSQQTEQKGHRKKGLKWHEQVCFLRGHCSSSTMVWACKTDAKRHVTRNKEVIYHPETFFLNLEAISIPSFPRKTHFFSKQSVSCHLNRLSDASQSWIHFEIWQNFDSPRCGLNRPLTRRAL